VLTRDSRQDATSSIETDAQASEQRKELLERELDRYLQILTTRSDPERIIVFGSMASGEITAWSDIDLVIVQQTSLPFLKRTRQMRRMLCPRVGTDILVYTPDEFAQLRQTRAFFRDEILAKGVVLYERASANTDHLFGKAPRPRSPLKGTVVPTTHLRG
jgi:predicted nucleotidyltransferase